MRADGHDDTSNQKDSNASYGDVVVKTYAAQPALATNKVHAADDSESNNDCRGSGQRQGNSSSKKYSEGVDKQLVTPNSAQQARSARMP